MTTVHDDLSRSLARLAQANPAWQPASAGVTRQTQPIPALLDRDAYNPSSQRARVALVGGLTGQPADVALARRALELFAARPALAEVIGLSAVLCGNPDGLAIGVGPGNGAGGDPTTGYPPQGNYYYDAQNPEARYLWRWVCFLAPHVAVELRAGAPTRWEANAAARALAPRLGAAPLADAASLPAALGQGEPDGLGTVPALRLTTVEADLEKELGRLWEILQSGALEPSPARRALDSRLDRSPLQVARALAGVYGRKLEPLVYTQGVPISGRLRLAQLDPSYPNPAPDIAPAVERYAADPAAAFGKEPRAGTLGGVVWGAQLSQATGDQRYLNLLIHAANLCQPGGPGQPPSTADPDFRPEDMFNLGAILGRAAQITGERRYIDMQARFLREANIQQPDGLFWHSRQAPYFWGRGNGFAALGFAETLTYLPAGHPDQPALADMCRRQLDGLRRIQLPSGLWPNVLDFPGSYPEFTVTCMAGYAVARGLRRGWLNADYREMAERAWQGVAERVNSAGGVVDACTNTGVQKSLREYLDRPAVFGRDDRSGGMALWFAIEMERLRRHSV